MRVSVSVADLEPALGTRRARLPSRRRTPVRASRPGSRQRPTTDAGATGISNLQLSRARSVASSLDLRGARVDEALDP